MIDAFRLLGTAVVCRINDASATMAYPVKAVRVNEPGGEIENTQEALVEVWPFAKSTARFDRRGWQRTISIGVGTRSPVGTRDMETTDKLNLLFDQIEAQVLGVQETIDKGSLRNQAVFLGINLGEDRQAYIAEMLRQYDMYADVMVATFNAYYAYA